jgi:hypothetical protein
MRWPRLERPSFDSLDPSPLRAIRTADRQSTELLECREGRLRPKDSWPHLT